MAAVVEAMTAAEFSAEQWPAVARWPAPPAGVLAPDEPVPRPPSRVHSIAAIQGGGSGQRRWSWWKGSDWASRKNHEARSLAEVVAAVAAAAAGERHLRRCCQRSRLRWTPFADDRRWLGIVFYVLRS